MDRHFRWAPPMANVSLNLSYYIILPLENIERGGKERGGEKEREGEEREREGERERERGVYLTVIAKPQGRVGQGLCKVSG